MLNTTVDAVEQLEDGESYAVRSGDFCATARQVLIATGGKAAPMYGTTGDGYVMARKLGYELAPLHPALTGIETNVTTLKGVRARAIVTLYRKGDKIYEEFGQVQFTDYGMSGIVIMNASKLVELRDGLTFDDYELVLNFIPDRIDAELKALIGHRMEKGVNTIRGFVPQKLSSYIEARTEEQLQNPEENNDASEIYFRALRESHFKVTGVHGWKTAQCTAGGVKLDQVFERTMASRKHRGLYFAGEVLDECGPCGGFNLTQAFFTGLKAGRAMAFSSKIRRRF